MRLRSETREMDKLARLASSVFDTLVVISNMTHPRNSGHAIIATQGVARLGVALFISDSFDNDVPEGNGPGSFFTSDPIEKFPRPLSPRKFGFIASVSPRIIKLK